MIDFSRRFRHPAVLIVAVVLLLAAHSIAFYFMRHLAISTAMVSAMVVVVLIKHLGMLSPLYAWLRRPSRQ